MLIAGIFVHVELLDDRLCLLLAAEKAIAYVLIDRLDRYSENRMTQSKVIQDFTQCLFPLVKALGIGGVLLEQIDDHRSPVPLLDELEEGDACKL